ncbi:hypothetical protein [Saccharothrix deserti]|uniref:hypothetical protein n=1 Tax=Saccharothrix deserti TaxID=2593674 RepID=UPI00131BA0BF|nr:hypothetical protein [Saccharothrix deserti]
MRLRLLAVAVLLAGCASPVVDGATAPPPSEIDFPVDAKPRPIVLTGWPLVQEGSGGEAEKIAASNGRFAFTGAAPTTPAPTPVELSDGPATLPLIGAADAVVAMSAAGRDGTPLELVAVEFGQARFATDRGALDLPAWRFRSAFGSTFSWPAVAPTAFWRFGEVTGSIDRATTTDGVTLDVEMDEPAPPCPGEDPGVTKAVAEEGPTSVVVRQETTGRGRLCGDNALYQPRTFQVVLEEPLGARVLVDEHNGIITVTR